MRKLAISLKMKNDGAIEINKFATLCLEVVIQLHASVFVSVVMESAMLALRPRD